MALDETVFGAIARRWQAWRSRPDPQRVARDAAPATKLQRLRMIATAVAGRELEVRVHGGTAAFAGDRIWLPTAIDLLPTRADNDVLAIVMVTFAAAVMRRGLAGEGDADDDVRLVAAALALETGLREELPGWACQRDRIAAQVLALRPPAHRLRGGTAVLEAVVQRQLGATAGHTDDGLGRAQRDAIAAALAGGDLLALVRGFGSRRALPMVPLWGTLLPVSLDSAGVAGTPGDRDPSVTTERQGRPRGPVRRRKLDQAPREDNPLVHSFEKVHTAEEHRGGNKRADGSDELGDHHGALEELDLDEVVLSDERTSSVYQADASFLGACDDTVAEAGLHYDEWDPSGRRYLAGHCRLRVDTPTGVHVDGVALRARVTVGHRRALDRLRAALARVDAAMRWRNRQPDGSEVDIDAVVDRHAAIVAGHDGSDRLYVARRRRGHDVAVLVLLDASLSTDAWIDDRRVLDTERDATAMLMLALEPELDELGVAAFCSHTRHDCRFIGIKGFTEHTDVGLARLATLRPSGYTRIGPAIRHAHAALARTHARRRLLVLVTDGKPSDADRYEGRHGIGDVRQALREGQRDGIDTFALAIDPRARAHFPEMFGDRAFAGLRSADGLAEAASELFTQLRRR